MAKSVQVFLAYSGFQKFHLENTCFRFGLIRLTGGEQKIGMFSGSAAKRPVGSFKETTEPGIFTKPKPKRNWAFSFYLPNRTEP